MSRLRVVSIVGTRPEVIKMGPVIHELAAREEAFEQLVVTTAQHREMLDQALELFEIRPAVDLGLMEDDQSLSRFTARALAALTELFADVEPDCVLVQGDTTTVMTAALAAFYDGIAVGHVEAGLRSYNLRNPFPEEMNRRVAATVSAFHFAPTLRARQNLVLEGIADETIFLTGNTIVDALRMVPRGPRFADERLDDVDFSARVLLVTAHRRENHGPPLRSICAALRELAERYDDVEIVYPVHLSPRVQSTVHEELGDAERVHLVDPVSYADLLMLMERCHLILTDSGGIQEEAPSFRKPVLVLREVTERPELVESGFGRLIGTETDRVVEEVARLLTDRDAYERMTKGTNPFGDGRAAERIADILEERLPDRLRVERRAAEAFAS
jgi:UDP-N-acetylglucosamine 2-epimerase (non-hydrolysing)